MRVGVTVLSKKVTIQDIGSALGLSRNTVSKALANHESVGMETRQKVIDMAIEMSYHKLNSEVVSYVKQQRSSRSRNIAVLVEQANASAYEFWGRIIDGIATALSEENYNLVYCSISKEDEQNMVLPKNIMNHDVNGIIVMHTYSARYLAKLIETGLPLVYLDCPLSQPLWSLKGDHVMMEGESCIYDITHHLIEEGCKTLGFIGDITYCRTIYERWHGFERALLDAGMPIQRELCFTSEMHGRYYIYDEIEALLSRLSSMPDAFVCGNDTIAFLVMRYLKSNGYEIPLDVAVSGFDDARECAFIEPHLTSVHVYNEQLGMRLAREVLERITHPQKIYQVVRIASDVRLRESTDISGACMRSNKLQEIS